MSCSAEIYYWISTTLDWASPTLKQLETVMSPWLASTAMPLTQHLKQQMVESVNVIVQHIGLVHCALDSSPLQGLLHV